MSNRPDAHETPSGYVKISHQSPPTALDDQLNNDDDTGFYYAQSRQPTVLDRSPFLGQVENDDESGFYHTQGEA